MIAGAAPRAWSSSLPEWFYRGVLDRSLVLTIDPAYFRLTGGIERWLYRVARKHAGRQLQGWRFEMRHLHLKSGSQARFSDFALDVRRIAARQSLPGYRLAVASEAGRDLVLITPTPAMAAGGKPVKVFGTSGAGGHGTSGAPYIDSNRDSSLTVAGGVDSTLRAAAGGYTSNVGGLEADQPAGEQDWTARLPFERGRS